MDATNWYTRWRNAFVYALVTTVMVLGAATALSAALGAQQRALADRVDRNAGAVVCILQLGLEQKNSPPRDYDNISHCLADPSWRPLVETP